MAEFLIYNKSHWMDLLSQEQIAEYVQKYSTFQKKYDSRYQRGDIVEVREDGFYTSTLKGDLSKWVFRVVVISGLKPDKMYAEVSPTKRRRFAIPVNDGVVTTRLNLSDAGLQDKESLIG